VPIFNCYCLSQGNGRKTPKDFRTAYKPNFITWMPQKKELIDFRQPLSSSYTDNYSKGGNRSAQLYANRIACQASRIRQPFIPSKTADHFSNGYPPDPKEQYQTTYRKIHCTEDPTAEACKQLNLDSRLAVNGIRRTVSARRISKPHSNVASCLSWQHPPHKSRSQSTGTI